MWENVELNYVQERWKLLPVDCNLGNWQKDTNQTPGQFLKITFHNGHINIATKDDISHQHLQYENGDAVPPATCTNSFWPPTTPRDLSSESELSHRSITRESDPLQIVLLSHSETWPLHNHIINYSCHHIIMDALLYCGGMKGYGDICCCECQ